MHILLLGAGFTRNWGGWLASELVGDLLGRVSEHAELHQRLQRSVGDYEGLLGELRDAYDTHPTVSVEDQLTALYGALMASFGDMNGALAALSSMEFDFAPHMCVQRFLMKFDAIFTLNQDLLFELHYTVPPYDDIGFAGFHFPGMLPPMSFAERTPGEKLRDSGAWTRTEFRRDSNLQPIYKLHGSVNWRDRLGGDVVVMGTQKQSTIAGNELLRDYFEEFRAQLAVGNTRLMVIGYGWRDEHVNEALISATASGMRMFVVSPEGSDAFRPVKAGGLTYSHPLAAIPLLGESRRPLTSTFSTDALERGKLERFFASSNEARR
ncbi:SIR2 family protein [Caenimonas terrae]|uniref:SIR2 family protein n=1 Tax=Caenimonas terrae TaxID=696074 RepID=A0ABW0NLB3_9BURK